MAERSTIVESILDCGIDFKNRRIYYGMLLESYDEGGSDFTWRSVEHCIRALHIMEGQAEHKPIELHMDSPGGSPYNMLRLYDVIQSSPCQIKFYGGGMIMSSATWIMCACDERYLYPNTRVMIHDGPAGTSDEQPSKQVDFAISSDEEVYLQNKLNKIYADNSRMPIEFWEKMCQRDLYLSPEETIMLGLADKIVEPKKRGNLRRMRIAHLKSHNDHAEMGELLTKLSERIKLDKGVSITLRAPEEKFDKNIVVDNTPLTPEEETPAILPVAPAFP